MWVVGLRLVVGVSRIMRSFECRRFLKARSPLLFWQTHSAWGERGGVFSLVALLVLGSGCASTPKRDYDTLSYSGSGKLYLNGAEIKRSAVAESLVKGKTVIIAPPSVAQTELKALYTEVMEAGVEEVTLKRLSHGSTKP